MSQELTNDHDMLVELRTEFRGMRDDIKDLKDGTASRLATLEKKTEELETHKASKQDVEKIDSRLDRVRTTLNYIVGGLIIVNILLPFIFKFLFG
jgi:hypothetical protein